MQAFYNFPEFPYCMAQDSLGSFEGGILFRRISAHLPDGLYHVKSGDHTLYCTVVQSKRKMLPLLLSCNGIGAYQVMDLLFLLMCLLQRTSAFQDVCHREEAKIKRPGAEASVAEILPGEVCHLCPDRKRAKSIYEGGGT
jgi:hypothetical protein